jgi:hypothetical protein
MDSNWTLFRNLSLPDGEKGDIDIALVGPGGIFALEVKTYTGEFRVMNGGWYRKTTNGRWAKDPFGPGAQARNNAIRLNRHLSCNGIEGRNYVRPKVILAQHTEIEVVSTGTEIWNIDSLAIHLCGLRSRSMFSQQHVERVVSAIEGATVVPN